MLIHSFPSVQKPKHHNFILNDVPSEVVRANTASYWLMWRLRLKKSIKKSNFIWDLAASADLHQFSGCFTFEFCFSCLGECWSVSSFLSVRSAWWWPLAALHTCKLHLPVWRLPTQTHNAQQELLQPLCRTYTPPCSQIKHWPKIQIDVHINGCLWC